MNSEGEKPAEGKLETGEGCESEESMKKRAETPAPVPTRLELLEGVFAAARELRQHGVDLAGQKAKGLWDAMDKVDEIDKVAEVAEEKPSSS